MTSWVNTSFRNERLWKVFLFLNITPIPSMYGTFNYIYRKNQPNVGKYTLHGSYGCWKDLFLPSFQAFIFRGSCFSFSKGVKKKTPGFSLVTLQLLGQLWVKKNSLNQFLGKEKSSSNMPYHGDMLVPWRVTFPAIHDLALNLAIRNARDQRVHYWS